MGIIMWNKLTNLLGIDAEEHSENEIQIVTAALMVQVAHTHDELNAEEKKTILASIKNHFDLGDIVAQNILEQAQDQHNNATDLYSFTRVIMKDMDQEGQKNIVRLLYRVAFADKNLDHFEEQIIAKISGLLGIGVRDRVAIKQSVRAQMVQ